MYKVSCILAFLLLSFEAHATIYCKTPPVSNIFDKKELTIKWEMTSSKHRKILIPTQDKPTTHCGFSWQTLGGFTRPIEIIKASKLNPSQVESYYRISYKADKIGEDELIVKI